MLIKFIWYAFFRHILLCKVFLQSIYHILDFSVLWKKYELGARSLGGGPLTPSEKLVIPVLFLLPLVRYLWQTHLRECHASWFQWLSLLKCYSTSTWVTLDWRIQALSSGMAMSVLVLEPCLSFHSSLLPTRCFVLY